LIPNFLASAAVKTYVTPPSFSLILRDYAIGSSSSLSSPLPFFAPAAAAVVVEGFLLGSLASFDSSFLVA
jgi:hypothetical protein